MGLLAALVVLAALLAGCTPTATPQATVDRFTGQHLTWTRCDYGECATAIVPLDHDDPDGAVLTLALARARATASPHLGTLFINPGGPGASGRDYLRWFDRVGLENYDVVGWDPRGVGGSQAVVCLDGPQADAQLALDASPDDQAEADALADAAGAFATACASRVDADLLAHLSTLDNARDLDLLRQVVGDDTLRYLGTSYGTVIGAAYAALFPDRVGRLVLDAAVDVTWPQDVGQAVGFDRAVGNFAHWCAGRADCRLGDTAEAVTAAIVDLFTTLDATPLAVEDRTLTQSLASLGVASYLYPGDGAWPSLARAVIDARNGDGTRLLAAADRLTGRHDDGTYDGLFSGFRAISCADGPQLSREEADARWARDRLDAPVFGEVFGPDYTCLSWPVAPAIAPDWSAASAAAPIVVIGGRGDPATPYEWSQELTDTLGSAVLVTYTGEGHGAYGGRSDCVDAAVRSYLVEGTVPAEGTVCS